MIPAEFRQALGLKAGDALMMIFDGNSVRVMTRKALVDELIEVIPFDLEQSAKYLTKV